MFLKKPAHGSMLPEKEEKYFDKDEYDEPR